MPRFGGRREFLPRKVQFRGKKWHRGREIYGTWSQCLPTRAKAALRCPVTPFACTWDGRTCMSGKLNLWFPRRCVFYAGRRPNRRVSYCVLKDFFSDVDIWLCCNSCVSFFLCASISIFFLVHSSFSLSPLPLSLSLTETNKLIRVPQCLL